MLNIKRLSFAIGGKTLFTEASVNIPSGQKVGIVGRNGTGKTSLLQIIAAEDVSEGGSVTLRKGIRVGYLNQDPNFDNELTVKQLIDGSNSKFIAVIREYEAALEAQSLDYSEENIARFDEATSKMDEINGWNYEQMMSQVLSKFRINDVHQKAKNLSGG